MTNSFLWRKLHSLSGIFPIGIFLLEHMFINSLAVKGEKAFNQGVALLHSIPYLWALEVIIIFAPILFHAFYGIWVVYLTRNNVLAYSYFRNWLFYVQRVTAIITLIFVGWHVLILRFSSGEISFNVVAQAFSSPAVIVLYFIGLVATFVHFANGLWSFLISWGITIGEGAQRKAAYLSTLVFVVLTVVGVNALLAFK